MFTAVITQESFRSWCQTLIAVGAAWPLVLATIKWIKAKIETELAKRETESAKREAMNSLVAIAPALVEIASQFHTLKNEVSENTAITKQIQVTVSEISKSGLQRDVNLKEMAQDMNKAHTPPT